MNDGQLGSVQEALHPCCSCGSGAACYLPGRPELPGGAGGENWAWRESCEGGQ